MKKVSQKVKSTRKVSPKKSEFEKYLEEIEGPDYKWVAKDLPENASSLERAKYNLCEKILGYQEDNHLSDEKIARQIGIKKEKALQILFCWIENFTLDELISYANKLFNPNQIQVIIREVKPQRRKLIHARV